MATITAARPEVTENLDMCHPCDVALWKTGAHRKHQCRHLGCACPVCHPAPSAEIRDVLDALQRVHFLTPLAS